MFKRWKTLLLRMYKKISSLNTFIQLKVHQKLPSHFLLISKQAQLTKITFSIITTLLCPQNGECGGHCVVCQKVIKRDYDTLFVLKPPSPTTIKKDDLLTLFDWIEHTKFASHRRVYYIANLDYLTPTASNTLLKFLETTYQNCLGIFTTSNPQTLLPTVKSRLQSFYLDDSFAQFSPTTKLHPDLTEKDQQILELINHDLYSLDNDFFDEQYFPMVKLVNQFLSLIDQKKINDFYLIEQQQLVIKNFWLFLELLIIHLNLMINHHFSFASINNFLKNNKTTLLHLLDCCCRFFYDNLLFYRKTKSNLSSKNTFLYWMSEVNRIVTFLDY